MDKTPKTIRVVIADDHPIFRHGLKTLLESEPGFEVIGEATDGEQALAVIRERSPDILLLDLMMPRMPGLEVLRELSNAPAPVRTILLTAGIEKEQIVEALQLGARGIVLKEAATQLLFKSILAVMNGQFWVGRDSVTDLVATLRDLLALREEKPSKNSFGLTLRELEILGAIVLGLTNRDIAQKFSISEQTVKHHLRSIFDKVGVSNRLELAVFAINHRLVSSV
jgi:two-component system, NarL family, nitrate/nitrite response regulator NarL